MQSINRSLPTSLSSSLASANMNIKHHCRKQTTFEEKLSRNNEIRNYLEAHSSNCQELINRHSDNIPVMDGGSALEICRVG